MDEIGYTVESNKSFDDVADRLAKKAPEHNFRILAVHDVKATLAEKGFEIGPLKIFELCNAGFAYKAITADAKVAMFIPCKIVVRPEGDRTRMTLFRPTMISKFLPESGLDDLAAEVEKQIAGIMDAAK